MRKPWQARDLAAKAQGERKRPAKLKAERIYNDRLKVFLGLSLIVLATAGPTAIWEVNRIQKSRFCNFPAFRNFPYGEWYIKMIQNEKWSNSK